MGYSVPASIFIFHSHRWLNLHSTLCQQAGIGAIHPARSRHHDPADSRTATGNNQHDAWHGALQYYHRMFYDVHLHDPILKTIADQLVQHDDVADIHAFALPSDLADVLAIAEPIYRTHEWMHHDAANRAWIMTLAPMIEQYDEPILEQIGDAFQAGYPRAPLRVDLTAYAGWAGAYTTYNPPFPYRITIASLRTENHGWSGLETLCHEAAHTVVSPVRGRLVESITRARTRYGHHGPDDLWHVVLFYTVGSIVQRLLAAHDVHDYVPYAEQYNLYARVPGWRVAANALAHHWQPYLDDEQEYDAALDAVMRELQGDGTAGDR